MKWWNVTTKVTTITVVAGTLLCLLSVFAITQIKHFSGTVEGLVVSQESLRNQQTADMMHDALRSDVLSAILGSHRGDTNMLAEAAAGWADHSATFKNSIAANSKLELDAAVTAEIKKLAEPLQRYLDQSGEIVSLAATNKAAAEAKLAEFNNLFDALEDGMEKLSDFIVAGAAARSDAAKAEGASVIRGTLFGLVGGLVALSVLSFVVIRSIPKPFKVLIDRLQDSADQNRASASEVAKASQILANGASQQASSLEETSAALEEMAGMARRNAESAAQARSIAASTREAAEAGHTDVSELTLKMSQIKAAGDNVARIIKSIDEIAFQTNILALNASVEAARAGAAGAGFAVVADEVRNLAQRSAVAAKETADRITESLARSREGEAVSTRVATQLEAIVGRAREVDRIVGEMAGATTEQTQGIGQINDAVTAIDRVTQNNAASAEECSASAEELDSQARELRLAVDELQVLISGKQAVAAQSPASTKPKSPEQAPVVTTSEPASAGQPVTLTDKSPEAAFVSKPGAKEKDEFLSF